MTIRDRYELIISEAYYWETEAKIAWRNGDVARRKYCAAMRWPLFEAADALDFKSDYDPENEYDVEPCETCNSEPDFMENDETGRCTLTCRGCQQQVEGDDKNDVAWAWLCLQHPLRDYVINVKGEEK